MIDVVTLLRRVADENPGLVTTLGPPRPGLVDEAQARLGVVFPPAYRAFLESFGAVEIGPRPVYGLGISLDTVDGLNVVWHTEQARADRALGPSQLVLSSWDDLTLEVAHIADAAGSAIDGPVDEVLVEGRGERLASSFSGWLKRTIDEVRAEL